MRDTVAMEKQIKGGVKRIEIISNKGNAFGGNTKGKANWLVLPLNEKGYKVSRLATVYKQLKAEGFKVVGIY